MNTGLSVGYGAGASLVGSIADQHGARSAFLVVLGSSVAAGLLALLLHARVRADPHGAPQRDASTAVGAVRDNR